MNCPFTAARLAELRHEQHWSLAQIAVLATAITDEVATVDDVRQWFADAGLRAGPIDTATIDDARRAAGVLAPGGPCPKPTKPAGERRRSKQAPAQAARDRKAAERAALQEARRRAREAADAERAARLPKRETRPCSLCGADVTRTPSDFTCLNAVCSPACARELARRQAEGDGWQYHLIRSWIVV